MSIAYVIPIYNEEAVIEETTRRVVNHLRGLPGSEVLLIENGSTDSSPELVDRLAAELDSETVRVIASHSQKGYGHAVKHGIAISTADTCLLTAADLPFGFSDLEQFALLAEPPPIVVGSKAHKDTVINNSLLRRVMSLGFRVLRRVTIGMRVKDSQGTIFIRTSDAQRLLPELQEGAYFFSTELLALAQQDGLAIAEVPVDYSAPREGSKVNPIEDSLAMFKGLLRLRTRLKQRAPANS